LATLLDALFLALPIGAIVFLLSGGDWFDISQYQQNLHSAILANPSQALNTPPKTDLKWELFFEINVLVVSIFFWKKYKGATPGKKLCNIKIVDAKTFQDIDNKQAGSRSIGYIASTFIFLIGFIMVAFRKDKRGLHDLLAGTIVIYDESE